MKLMAETPLSYTVNPLRLRRKPALLLPMEPTLLPVSMDAVVYLLQAPLIPKLPKARFVPRRRSKALLTILTMNMI